MADKSKVMALILAVLGYALRSEYFLYQLQNSVGPKNKGRSIFFRETTQGRCRDNSRNTHLNAPPIICAFSAAHGTRQMSWTYDVAMCTNRSVQWMRDKWKGTTLILAVLVSALRGEYFVYFCLLLYYSCVIFVSLAQHLRTTGSSYVPMSPS